MARPGSHRWGRLLAAALLAFPAGAQEPEAEADPANEPDWIARGDGRLPLLTPCEPPNVPGGALCGTIEVAEDRSRPGGRRIGLHVVVLPAHAEDPPGDVTACAERLSADGVQLAVQCSEHMGGFDVDRALAWGEATLFGSYRLAQQVQGCAHWSHRRTDHSLGVPRPRPLPIPTVMISGRWDPVTPPAYGETFTGYLDGTLAPLLP